MKTLRSLFATALALLAIPAALAAQDRGTVTGVVIDVGTQQPLAAVQVTVAGTQLGTTTNREGRFLIPNVPTWARTIRAIFIGYGAAEASVDVPANGSVTANFELRQSAITLEGVTVSSVTGQATRRRELGTNSGNISTRELELAPITSVSTALTGRVAGVSLQGVSGTVGGSQRIRIRGANSISLSNEPLIFIDGILSTNSKGISFGTGGQDVSRLNDLNQDDIENIEILKGPAASALYGTAAANGVILITTRRGRAGTAEFRAYTEMGTLEDKTEYAPNFLPYQVNNASAPLTLNGTNLNGAGYTACYNENAARGLCRQDELISKNWFTSDQAPFTKGFRNKYGVSALGGSEGVTFFLSGDWEEEQGALEYNTLERLSLRANLDGRLTDNLKVSVNSNYVASGLVLNSSDNSIFSPIINGILASPFEITQQQIDASSPGGRPGAGFGYYIEDFEPYLYYQEVDRFILGSSLNYTPRTWLTANVNVGMDQFSRNDVQTLQPNKLFFAATAPPGWRDATAAFNLIVTANASTTATFELNDWIVSTSTLGGSFNRERFSSINCFGVGIVAGTRSCSATSSLFSVSEGFSEVRTVGAFFQQQFGFNDRIFVAASLRGDDNSAFGSDFGLIAYPSASLSWVISDEAFFPEIPRLSNLRLRTAYGQSGLRPNFRDAVTLLVPVAVRLGHSELSGVTLSSTGNLELKPELSSEIELGFDAGFLEDRLAVEFTYYNKESQDALIARPLAPSYGLTGSVFDNLGSITNSGTETTINARVLERSDVSLNVRLTATTLKNNLKELGEGVSPITFNRGLQRHAEGFPAGGYWARPYTYTDPDGNGLISPVDVVLQSDTSVFIGSSLPTNSQSLSFDLTLLRNIRVSTLFDRRAGHYQSNATEAFACRTTAARANRGMCEAVGDPTAPAFKQARHLASRFRGSDFGYIEKADFIKWREVALTVFAPESLVSFAPMLRGSSLTLSGRNLLTWTDYTGYDPEINETGGGTSFTQGEFNTAPPLRHLAIRVNLAF